MRTKIIERTFLTEFHEEQRIRKWRKEEKRKRVMIEFILLGPSIPQVQLIFEIFIKKAIFEQKRIDIFVLL